MADQLVSTGLSAEMLRPGGQQVERVPPANAQLSGLFIRYKPMVGLVLLRSADIACYDLPDHCRSPSVTRSPTAENIGFCPGTPHSVPYGPWRSCPQHTDR